MRGQGEDVFDTAISALHSLRLFRRYYASGPEYQAHVNEVLELLRSGSDDPGHGKFLHRLADAIEEGFRSGP